MISKTLSNHKTDANKNALTTSLVHVVLLRTGYYPNIVLVKSMYLKHKPSYQGSWVYSSMNNIVVSQDSISQRQGSVCRYYENKLLCNQKKSKHSGTLSGFQYSWLILK